MSETTAVRTLADYDYTVVVDASGSMNEVDPGQSKSRFQVMEESVKGLIAELSAIDENGIDLITFGGTTITHSAGIKSAAQVAEVFSRRVAGGTPLAQALEKAFDVAGKSDKPDFILVFTDGAPDSQDAVREVIRAQAAKQEQDDDLTVLFVQVGNDPGAAQFLAELDDGLNAKFDIVDTMTQVEADSYASLAALISKAIND